MCRPRDAPVEQFGNDLSRARRLTFEQLPPPLHAPAQIARDMVDVHGRQLHHPVERGEFMQDMTPLLLSFL
jgi:hypothetical protein